MPSGLRIVVMTVSIAGYRLVADWAASHDHDLVLVVAPSVAESIRRYGGDQVPLAQQLPERQDALLTARLGPVATPVISALQPDLLVSASYPRLIPSGLLTVPQYGAVNLHPSALPRGRGPNPQRLIYEGDTTAGATLHKTAAEFDTGAILSTRERPLPDSPTALVLRDLLAELLTEVLEEGTNRLFAGEPGEPQDASSATYAGHFTQDERWLDLKEPAAALQRRTAALNLATPSALAKLGDQEVMVLGIDLAPDQPTGAWADVGPGQLIRWEADEVALVQVGDSVVRMRIC
jgi:methionyl-tRNA formyltransferase